MKNPLEIRVTVAGILFSVCGPLSAAELGIAHRFQAFHEIPGNPRRRIAVRWMESREPPQPHGERIYDPGGIWRMYRSGTDYYAHFTYDYPAKGVTAQTQAVLRANPAWDDLELREQRSGPSWRSVLGSGPGELILRVALWHSGGVILHGATVDDHGRGIALVGHSGAGKSTLADLWSRHRGVTVVNHDRVAIRAERDGARCYGIPWGGTQGIALNRSMPLAAVIVLEQARENAIQRCNAKMAGRLASLAFLPYWDPELIRLAMINLDAILKRIAVYRLRFRPDQAVVPLIRSAL